MNKKDYHMQTYKQPFEVRLIRCIRLATRLYNRSVKKSRLVASTNKERHARSLAAQRANELLARIIALREVLDVSRAGRQEVIASKEGRNIYGHDMKVCKDIGDSDPFEDVLYVEFMTDSDTLAYTDDRVRACFSIVSRYDETWDRESSIDIGQFTMTEDQLRELQYLLNSRMPPLELPGENTDSVDTKIKKGL